MFSINQKIPFSLKLKIRGLGWIRQTHHNFKCRLIYLMSNFYRYRHENDYLPQDSILTERLRFEKENYDPYRHQEIILRIEEPVVVEPLSGAVIAGKCFIIEDAFALPTSQSVALPFLPEALYRINQASETIEQAICLRHSWGENNYFHFYNDILPKLALLHEIKIFDNYPIIVAKKLYEKSFFQDAIHLAGLQNKHWIIQDTNYLKVKNLVIIRAHELTVQGIYRNLRFLRLNRPEVPANKRIFLTRATGGLRNLGNREVIVSIAQELDFDIVDCAQLSLRQQIHLFQNSRIIVGEHGAAFSNIIYRYGNPLNLLEIFPPHHISTCYFVICQALGYRHAVLRSESPTDENYEVHPELFREKLKRILENINN